VHASVVSMIPSRKLHSDSGQLGTSNKVILLMSSLN
jgi:hypothetical protein